MSSLRCVSPLAGILFAALALRVATAVWLTHDLDVNKKRPFLIMWDAVEYWELGERIAHGKPYEIYDPPRRVMRMPGYPAFVAGSIRLAEALGMPDRARLIARLLLSVVGTATCGLVALLGRELFDARVGTVAAAISALAPPLVGFSVVLLSEAIFTATMLVSLWCVARLVRATVQGAATARLVGWGALSGVAIAMAVYVRPSWLLAAPSLAVTYVLYFRRTRRLSQSLAVASILVGCTYAVLSPWAFRNFQVTGHWVFTALWAGPSLYDGFNPAATGQTDLRFFDKDHLLDRMTEYEVDRAYTHKASEFIREHPGRALQLTVEKIKRFWSPWPNTSQFAGPAFAFAVAVYFIPLLMTSVVGWIRGPRWFWGWTLAVGPILYFAAIHTVFLGSLRYRFPAEFPLCIAAAVGCVRLCNRPVAAGIDPSSTSSALSR